MTTAPALNLRFDPVLLSRIEDAGLNASAPPQQRWIDGWLLRFSPGKAKRARCINAVAEGRMPVQDRLRWCEQVFAQNGLPLLIRITPFTQPQELGDTLQSQAWLRMDDTRVMVLDDIATLSPPGLLDAAIDIHPIGLEAFAQRVGTMRGSPLAQRRAHAERLLSAPVPFTAFELRSQNEVWACGQYAIEGDLVGLYDVFTSPDKRGQGLSLRLCRHLLALACEQGARHAYLQVEADNVAARAVYQKLGFSDAYAYHYVTPLQAHAQV